MSTELEYVPYSEFVAGLSTTENPTSADKTVISNPTNGPRAVPGSAKDRSTTLTAFREGDTIPVDGTPLAKMPYANLLNVSSGNTFRSYLNETKADVGYLKTSGTMSTNDAYHCQFTAAIPVTPGDVINYQGCGRSDAASAVFYTAARAFLSYVQVQSEDAFSEIIVPENAAFAKIASFAPADADVVFNFSINESPVKFLGASLNRLIKDFLPSKLVPGKFLDSYGALEDAAGTSLLTDFIPVKPGDTFLYSGVARASTRSVVFYGAGRTYLSNSAQLIDSPAKLVEIVVPENSHFARFSSYSSSGSALNPLVVAKKDSQLGQILLKVQGNERLSVFDFSGSVGFMKTDGTFSPDESRHCLFTDYLPAAEGDKFLYLGIGRSLSASAIFCNSQKQVISYVQINNANEYTEVTCPQNCAFVRFSSFTAVGSDVPFNVIRVPSQLGAIFAAVKDLEDKSTAIVPTDQPGWLRSNGAMSTTSGYHCLITDYIKTKPGDKFIYRGKARSDAVSAVFFSSTGSVVSYAQHNAYKKPVEITTPSGAALVRFCSFDSSDYGLIFDVVKVGSAEWYAKINGDTDKLENKRWVVCGDSFSHGDFTSITEPKILDGIYAGQLPVYSFLIGNRTKCNVDNIAVNGGTLSYVNNGGFTKPSTGLLYTTDFSDADYITLYYGINDMHQNVPIGTINDTEPTTFYGAWNVTLEYLITNYPGAKIGVIITNGCGASGVAYPTATEAICKKWGVPYLDLDGGVGCATMLRCSTRNPASDALKGLRYDQQKVSATNGHPNELAHKIESTFIEAWLKSL